MQIGDKINKNSTIEEHISFSQELNINGFSVEDKGEYYEVVENAPYVPTVAEQIAQLKAELASYDYIGVKIAMGVATVEEYADQIAYTQTLRNRINELGG